MDFEIHGIKPYAEPASVSEFRSGDIYFMISYVDDEMKIPIIETIAFAGKDGDILLFQDAESYLLGVNQETCSEQNPIRLFKCSEDQVSNIFQYENALHELIKCRSRRGKSY